jgi:hypothetical protein
MSEDYKEHWEKVYKTKSPNEVSWTQENPKTSIDLINSSNLPKSCSIIDIGGGDSLLVDFLLHNGYENITVLDVSSEAIKRAKKRLGVKADKVNWIVSNITDFSPEESYDIWHDRATFHFLNTDDQINKYVNIVKNTVNKNLVIGTFSDDGPLKCSGMEIVQYTEKKMSDLFSSDFKKLDSFKENHTTPFNTIQNFIFCSFIKKSS